MISADVDGEPNLLFDGRVGGAPIALGGETITVELLCRPDNWQSQQASLVETLQADGSYWHPLLVPKDRRNMLEETLAERAALVFWPRAGGAPSTSDILEGELIDLGSSHVDESLSIALDEPPVTRIRVTLEVEWEQWGRGLLDLTDRIKEAFTAGEVSTLTPDALEQSWGSAFGGNWAGVTLAESKLERVATEQTDGVEVSSAVAPSHDPALDEAEAVYEQTFEKVYYEGKLTYSTEYQQKRRETVSIVVEFGKLQEVQADGGLEEEIVLRLEDVSDVLNTITGWHIDSDGIETAIKARPQPGFFFHNGGAVSDHGRAYFEAAIRRAMARLARSARCQLEAEWPLTAETLAIDTDRSLRIVDDRLPGGSARGKAISWQLEIDGDFGTARVRATIGRRIGTGELAPSVEGTAITLGTYAHEGGGSVVARVDYADPEEGSDPIVPINASQLHNDSYMVDELTVTNAGRWQESNIGDYDFDGYDTPEEWLRAHPTSFEVKLRSLASEDELALEPTVATVPMRLPRHIDLEAS